MSIVNQFLTKVQPLMTGVTLYNSLSRSYEAVPVPPDGHMRVYACGPTVYGPAHIGNARMAVVFDVLVRLLRAVYPRVTYASNITDIDDKIMQAATETGEPIHRITARFTDLYNSDMAALGVRPPDIQPRATDHVGDMIEMIAQLIARGHAYGAEGHVLFHVPSYARYGELSGRSRDEQIAGARVDVAPFKRDPADFVLWKPSAPDQPGWDSPWGCGRPGWHIECSAMAARHLGVPFHIHGGGADLKFPHHENEIAQSCCAHGHSHDPAAFARLWVHNGFVTVDGEKMSKSLGNFVTAHELLADGVDGLAIRLALMSGHYRAPLDWTQARLHQAQRTLDRFAAALGGQTDAQTHDPVDAPTPPDPDILDALKDDLNTHRALDLLIHRAQGPLAGQDRARFAATLDLLGLRPSAPPVIAAVPAHLVALAAEREAARTARNFAEADRLRALIDAAGYAVEDTKAGPDLRKK